MSSVIAPKKLIEVALPLDAINAAAAREKSIRHGHPSTLHLWWARRPLAAARAVIFAQLVNDPSWKWEIEHPGELPPGHLKATWAKSRKRLFGILEELVKWENTTNEEVLEKARAEIRKSWRETCEANKDHPQAAELFDPEKLPGLHDPFAGGGAIPLEAQRLGLEAYASDLNPVAVLINKAMIEIPPRFAGRPPVGPLPPSEKGKKLDLPTEWKGASGLAEDVRRYGAWMRAEAEKRIGHLYPRVEITAELAEGRPDLKPLVGQKLTVIAWLWARTVKSPNPAFAHVDVPLASTFILSSKTGKEAYVQPRIEGDSYRFEVCVKGSADFRTSSYAAAKSGTTAGKRAAFNCLMSSTPVDYNFIRAEGKAGRMGQKLMAIVAEGPRSRVYLAPTDEMELTAATTEPHWSPEMTLPANTRDFKTPNYGLTTFGDLFTQRQLVALTTFSDLVAEVREKVLEEGSTNHPSTDDRSLDQGGSGPRAYADTIKMYLAFSISKASQRNNTLCTWEHPMGRLGGAFGRQAIPMTWDYAETNPLAGAGGDIYGTAVSLSEVLDKFLSGSPGCAFQSNACQVNLDHRPIVSTDPPYYDNIGYADLSDFFYIWLRRNLKEVFPGLLNTIVVPKSDELVATPYRHGGKEPAESFFLAGMTLAMGRIAEDAHPSSPISIYYAFKQSDTKYDNTSSTGWETFLEAVQRAGLQLTGTWPMRTELTVALKKRVGALASSIVLVCRKRPDNAPITTRRDFQRELNRVLPEALDEMTRGSGDEQSPVAPVDLSQAIIGPGMAIFSRYSAVLEADGSSMSVKTALQLINRFLAEDDFDADTQFCLHWFEQHGWEEGLFGVADVLSRSKATSVNGIAEAGVIESGGGKVRLLKWSDYPADWDPSKDQRKPVWESLHQLIRAHRQGGDTEAGKLLAHLKPQAEAIRQLAYRLYTLCERQRRAEDARAYNELITSWSAIESASADHATRERDLFD